MNRSTPDEDLMCRYREGDPRAFEVLYARHRLPLYRYLLRQCRIEAVAADLFQDVWASVIRAAERYEAKAAFTTWLYRIAHNRLIDYYRRQKTGVPISYDDDPDDPLIEQVPDDEGYEPENEFDLHRRARKLVELLAGLPEAQREAFLLRVESGLSFEQIAEVTGVNPETAKSRVRYAIEKLRQALTENDR